jgi:hypothetical protein
MKRGLIAALLLFVVGCLIVVIVFWSDSAHWFLRYTGADAEAGTWYGFWSGFGGAIPDFLILLGSRSKEPLISPARRTIQNTRAASDRCQRM